MLAEALDSLTVEKVSVHHPDAVLMMDRLSGLLEALVGNPGREGFADWVEGDPLHVFVVAYRGGTPVGCGGVRPLDPRRAEIKRMYASASGRGVGSAILAHLEDTARQLGFASAVLETRAANEAAIGFYVKRGYERIPAYGRYAGRPDAVCFEKAL